METYDNMMVLFGGGGEYHTKLNMRSSFNDIWTFDLKTLQWTKRETLGYPPKKRMMHASSLLGSLMLVHGGVNPEGKIVLDDYNLYDIESNRWLKAKVTMNGVPVESHAHYGKDEIQDEESFAKVQ